MKWPFLCIVLAFSGHVQGTSLAIGIHSKLHAGHSHRLSRSDPLESDETESNAVPEEDSINTNDAKLHESDETHVKALDKLAGKLHSIQKSKRSHSGFINTGPIDTSESDETEEDAASNENFINTGAVHLLESDETEENAVPKSLRKSHSSKTSKKPHSDKPLHVPDGTPLYSKKDTDVHSGEASTWGKGLYKTFDNHMFSFDSFCNFTFCRHCIESGREFNIEMSRNRDGKIDQISIVLDGNVITVKAGKILVNHIYVQVPYDNKMIHIKKYGDYTKLESRRGILTLLWNNEDKLSITLHKKYDTCGLCGSHHAGTGIDVIKLIRDSKIPDTTCPEPVMEQGLHCGEGEMYCHGIISKYFKSCKNIGDQYHEYERLCTEEYCQTGSEMDVCSTFLELARRCSSGGSGPFEAWRRDPDVVCDIPTCPESEIYRDCGPSNQATCSYMSPYQDTGCVSGCVCPEGYVIDDIGGNGKCIQKTKCSCKFNGKVYRSGEKRKGPCNSECTCQDAKWACTESLCPGRCAVEGPFITTFDGASYTYAGDCHFVAIQHKDWSLSVELRHCHTGPAETCLKSVTLALGLPLSADKYIFHSNGSFVNDKIKHKDYYASDTIIIFKRSSSYIEAELYYGLKIQIQLVPTMQLYATLPAKKYASTRGLCGSFNNKAEDDFMSSQNILEVTPEAFARSWEIMTCPKARHPSCASIEKEKLAKEKCAILTDPNGVFAAGHFTVDYRSYYEKCLISTCVCEEIKDCLCTALGNYVKACGRHGVYITGWRKGICEQNCEEDKVFQYNIKACNTSCRSFSEKDLSCDVEDSPVDGCNCPEGLYKNSKGVCVKQDICDCYVDDKVLMTGQHIKLNNYTCVCQRGQFFCHNLTDLKPVTCGGGAEFVTCSNPNAKRRVEKTCNSLNMPHLSMDMPCTPGCYCPLGMARDNEGQCIPPTHCPCSYSGRKYEQGSKINIGCNTCTCVEGAWKCTTEKCQSSCHIYGDGQIQTFDGMSYSYDGFCQYVLAEDYCGKEDGSFKVLTESIPCCEDGVTCSRKITMILEGGTLVLEDGKFMFIKDAGNTTCTDKEPFTVHTVGLYLIIRYIHGITLIWDKNTRVSIIMDSDWNKQICGLCGNHNGNLQDEFTTRLGSLAAGPVEFGNSWKTIPMCSDKAAESFPCDANAYCKDWAVRKCEIIRDHHFKACHNKIDPTPYHKACIEEACACTMEGKYLGFCTAVSMYAEACTAVGICISWRTPELCPVFCDYYNAPGGCSWHYEPCGSVITKTCKNHESGWTLPSVLEGCYAKCPEHAPYLDENTMKCVHLSDCTCYHNSIIFPGEIISDECGRQCVCRSGKLECSDLPVIPRFGEAPKLNTDTTTVSTTATTSAMTTHMIGTGRKEEEKTSGFIGSTSQTLQTKSFTKGASGTVGWNTGVPGNATEHVESLTKTTTAMVGHDKSSTGVSPSMHITSSAIKWNTGVTRRPTEHVVLRRSTEGRESATAQTDGHDKPYTAVSSKTRRSITASLVKQNTEYKKTTERTAVRSSTESKKATKEFDKPHIEVPAGTTTDSSSNSVTWNKDVTKHLRVQSSTESTERVTRQAKQNTVGPWGTVVRFGEALKLKTDATTVSTTATTSAMTTHMVGTGRKEEEKTSGFIGSTSQTLQTKGFTKNASGTVGWNTGVPGNATEHVESLTKTTTAMVGHDKSSTGVSPSTSMHITSSAIKWNTGVTRRPTEHVVLRRSTEGRESATAQTDGHDKPYTAVSSKTRRSITASLVKQNTEYKKTTERTAVRSSTESKKATAKFDKPYTEVPAGTITDSSSNSVTWNKDVTKHLRGQSSTESTKRVTRQAKQNTVGPWGTVVGVTKRNGGSESTANLGKTQKWMDTWHYSTGPPRGRGSTVWVTTKDNGIPVTDYTEVHTGCPETPEPTSCRFKSKHYKIGETFKDPDNPCLKYTCTNEGFTTEVEECIGQNWCQNTSRIYRKNKCCYDCVNQCRPVPMPIKIKINGCSDTIIMSMCTGECPKSLIYGEVDRLLLNKCSCCQATGHVYRNIPIICRTGKVEVYTYKHVISCSCQNCKSP